MLTHSTNAPTHSHRQLAELAGWLQRYGCQAAQPVMLAPRPTAAQCGAGMLCFMMWSSIGCSAQPIGGSGQCSLGEVLQKLGLKGCPRGTGPAVLPLPSLTCSQCLQQDPDGCGAQAPTAADYVNHSILNPSKFCNTLSDRTFLSRFLHNTTYMHSPSSCILGSGHTQGDCFKCLLATQLSDSCYGCYSADQSSTSFYDPLSCFASTASPTLISSPNVQKPSLPALAPESSRSDITSVSIVLQIGIMLANLL